MGSGCSSPLKRFGGKKANKSAKRDSTSSEGVKVEDCLCDHVAGPTDREQSEKQQPSQNKSTAISSKENGKEKICIIESEITVQSEANEDHPSSTSCYTESKAHNDDNKSTEQPTSKDPKASKNSPAGSGAMARMMGLNGAHILFDRHLLVSPALSPAPSTCYSPSPAGTTHTVGMDLCELADAFRILTLSSDRDDKNEEAEEGASFKPYDAPKRTYNTKNLIQCHNDLVKQISVALLVSSEYHLSLQAQYQNEPGFNSNAIPNLIESSLRVFCDENSYGLTFLNLSHLHLNTRLRVNNQVDASIRILEQQCQIKPQIIVIIVLTGSTNSHTSGNQSLETVPEHVIQTSATLYNELCGELLPSKVEAQVMQNLVEKLSATVSSSSNVGGLMKRWYNQVGTTFYLNPIHLVNPKIQSGTIEDREEAWKEWQTDLRSIRNSLSPILREHPGLSIDFGMKTLFSAQMDHIIGNQSLHKRTLLVKDLSLPTIDGNTGSHQSGGSRDDNLSELTRLLADPNKLIIKRLMSFDELIKSLRNWIMDNFTKILESIFENQISYGKHIPPFIERDLFVELTLQRHQLNYYLRNTSPSFQTKCQNFYTSQIAILLEPMKSTYDDGTISNSNSFSTSPDQESPMPLSYSHLVFISGPKGCGKSTLFSQIIRSTAQDLLNKAQIIYRFCGVSSDSLNSNRVMRSICEQFCQIQGENTTAASYIYSAWKDVITALNKSIRSRNSLIFLDELEKLGGPPESDDFSWLCRLDASPNLKIFIMLETDSELYRKALGSYPDATHITLDHPTIGEWAQMLTSTARSRRLNSTSSLYDSIKNANENESTKVKLTYNHVSDILNVCRMRQLNNESIYPEMNPKNMQPNLSHIRLNSIYMDAILQIQYVLRPYQVGAFLLALQSSRNGLSETDLVNILTLISSSTSSSTKFSIEEHKFSLAILKYVLILVEPWLIIILCKRGGMKLTLRRDFLAGTIKSFVDGSYPKLAEDVRAVMLEYFGRKTRSSSLTTSTKSNFTLKSQESANLFQEIRSSVNQAEAMWLANQASELAHLLIQTNPSKALEFITDKHQFFVQFLFKSMPEEFLEDCAKLESLGPLKKSPVNSEELACLINLIRNSVHPLRADGAQIYSQIYCRSLELIKSNKLAKGKRIADIVGIASCPPSTSLLPASETSVLSFIKARIGQLQQQHSSQGNAVVGTLSILTTPCSLASSQKQNTKSSSSQQSILSQIRQKIFTIKDNHRHVIVIHTEKGSLAVWDLFEEKPVRTINNLEQPRDLRMIDQRRAVVLCNRELKVYDLNSGQMLVKFKGVMNQKMPYFEVFGDNYVIALARNRMYVNMLNLSTGELETTFKVGEDRFLNSLLVSANGGICVCGDETQKPFPLLVWNLNDRRLLYDLRLERHEFITRMSAISDDGHFVVSVCKQLGDNDILPHVNLSSAYSSSSPKSSPNFIVIYDLNSGTLFKKWKPGVDTCAVAICLPQNKSGKVINATIDSNILIWDLSTGSKRHTLVGHSAPADVLKVMNNRVFSMDSSCRDQSLRIWDLEEGYCLTVFTPDAPIHCCQLSTRGDALICGFASESRLSTLIVCKNETINDVIKRNKRRKSSKSLYIFDDPPSRKSSS